MAPNGVELDDDMQRLAQALVQTAAAHGYELDYSLDSLATLDGMLDDMFRVRSPLGRMRGKLAIKRFQDMVVPVGAYVGETLRRAVGGRWAVHEEWGEGLLLPPDRWMFPVAKAEKRFRHGHGDSLAFYGEVMVDLAGGGVPDR